MKYIFIICIAILPLFGSNKIVSLSPAVTEIVYALNKGSELVATSSYSLYPKQAQKLPVIGQYTNPNIEKIISYKPTLVIGESFNDKTLLKVKSFGIHTLQLNLKTLDSIKKSILLLAKQLGVKEYGISLVNSIQKAINNVHNSKKSHSVMIVYGLREDLRSGIYIAGKNIFFDDIIKICGNTNAYLSNAVKQPVLSYENIIAIDPQQVIILYSKVSKKDIDIKKALKNWYELPIRASKNHKISIVDDDYIHIPSQRVAKTIKRLCREMND